MSEIELKNCPQEVEKNFKRVLELTCPAHFKLVKRLDECFSGKERITINADFATEIEDEIFQIVCKTLPTLQAKLDIAVEALEICIGDIIYLTQERTDKNRFGDTIHAIEQALQQIQKGD